MSLVFDTDIISTFGKIKRLDLLKDLFPNTRFFIPPSVYNELFKARERGYEFVDYVIESGILEVAPLNKEELELLSRLREERRSLGLGELEGVSICEHREYILVTNDRAAKKVCDQYGIEFIDLRMILKSLLVTAILTDNELKALIYEIERRDRVTIKDKGDILRGSRDN
jgi:predicted nucleic acid-binding protein